MKKVTLYLVCTTDEFELPVFCGSSKETMQYLGIISRKCFYCDVCRGTRVHDKFRIINSGVKEIQCS